MAQDTCPTVNIKSANESGYTVINESDFDATVHELFEVPVLPPAPPAPLAPTAA